MSDKCESFGWHYSPRMVKVAVTTTKPQRVAIWITERMPRVLVSDTERVGISIAFIAVGFESLLDIPYPTIPLASALMWSVTLLLGGVFTIWGITIGSRSIERFGLVLASWGCFTYGTVILAVVDGKSGWVFGVLFLGLGLIKTLRLVISSASEARSDHVPSTTRKG